jgi:glycosyltransferase involved in cell wall biosynthesis
LTDEVELLVLDGASTDDTETILRAYQKKCPNLKYIRRDSNQGVDRDYSTAVELASGDYCWLMTDDDLLGPGALGAVLNAIHEDHSLVIVNAEIRNADLSEVLDSRRMAIQKDRTFAPSERDDFFKQAGSYLSFIGCVIIKRSIWLERDKEPYFGTLFIHVGVIFQSPLPGSAHVIAEPLITIRYGNAMWRPQDFEIWMFKWPKLIWSFNGVSDEAKNTVCSFEPWRKLSTLFMFRAKGTYSLATYRKYISPCVDRGLDRVGPMAIACLPGVLTNTIALFYSVTVRRDPPKILFELQNSRYYFPAWLSRQKKIQKTSTLR